MRCRHERGRATTTRPTDSISGLSADRVHGHRSLLARIRLRDAEPAIRASFRKLLSLYPDAEFPGVYFIVGRFITGGLTAASGIVVAAELYDSPAKLPGIVAHELVHVQQPPSNNEELLLARAIREGSADFIGEMISGVNINPAAQQYGKAHERELWRSGHNP